MAPFPPFPWGSEVPWCLVSWECGAVMGKASQFSKSQHRNNTYPGFSLSDRADPRQISPATEALRTAAQQRRSRLPRHRLGGHTVCPPPAAQASGTTWWPHSLCSSHLVQLESEGRWKQTSGRPEYKLSGETWPQKLTAFQITVLSAGCWLPSLGPRNFEVTDALASFQSDYQNTWRGSKITNTVFKVPQC